MTTTDQKNGSKIYLTNYFYLYFLECLYYLMYFTVYILHCILYSSYSTQAVQCTLYRYSVHRTINMLHPSKCWERGFQLKAIFPMCFCLSSAEYEIFVKAPLISSIYGKFDLG